ncbi:succinylglutamate desuccinylase [Vibrio nitrifigilis]|uniref:Succinylglutamate desuccinylase n=1 Tax=Vibrio nitrifigilis TaxID=2789781 RepID=A0ABS0GCU3_9VIBR|nr:succinylglutamate desuccinylase [Vibrio nitrifigilis]MBF9000175.1 succinylglutamate desuccinylase [Vibrio nitrifigilis]
MTSLFHQSFLADTLDMTTEVLPSVCKNSNGVTLKLHQRGILEVVPAQQTPNTQHVVISAGVHGDETAPLELMEQWVNKIENGSLAVETRCLFIIAHPKATNRYSRFLDTNLNRLFDEKPQEPSLELAIADNLKIALSDFFAGTRVDARWHLDLHCAIRDSKHLSFAVSPRSRHMTRSRKLVDFLQSAEIEALMLSNAPSSTFSWYSAEYMQAQALTVELGTVAPLGQNDLTQFTAFSSAIMAIIANDELPKTEHQLTTYRVSRTIVRLHEDFRFLFDDNVKNFTSFMHGEVFGHDGDKPLMAQNEGEAIVFPNRHVDIGQRAALMVCNVVIRYENDQIVYD